MISYDIILDLNPWWQISDYQPEASNWYHRHLFSKLKTNLNEDLVMMLTGLRRTGKSTLLFQLIGYLLKKGIKPSNILYFSFDKYLVDKSPNTLEKIIKTYFERRLQKKIFEITEKKYLLLDEIQYIDYWPDIIKRFYDQNKKLKFLLTGSQSIKLKGKSKESLAGRICEYHLPCLDFEESINIKGEPGNFKRLGDFNQITNEFEELYDFHYQNKLNIENQFPYYLCFGQFPETVSREDNINFAYEYIKESVLGKILEQDIPNHYGIEKIQVFKSMAYHLITNSSSVFAINNIGSQLGISKVTVENYLRYLKESSLIGILHKYTKSPIKKGRTLKKAYSISTNFITAINKYLPDYYEQLPEVFGKIVETYVWSRLVDRFENLALWRSGEKEVDFLAPETGLNKDIVLFEVKFSSNIRFNQLKYLFSLAEKMKCRHIFIITKNILEKRKHLNFDIYLIPFYLI